MTQIAKNELFSIFDARRVKAPELRGLDASVNSLVGWVKNRQPVLSRLKAQADRIEALEPKVRDLGSSRFKDEVASLRGLARRGRLLGPALDMAMAVVREAAV